MCVNFLVLTEDKEMQKCKNKVLISMAGIFHCCSPATSCFGRICKVIKIYLLGERQYILYNKISDLVQFWTQMTSFTREIFSISSIYLLSTCILWGLIISIIQNLIIFTTIVWVLFPLNAQILFFNKFHNCL